MRKRLKSIVLYFLVIPMSLLILAVIVYTIFEYSLVADIKEAFVEVEEQAPLEYGKVLFETRGCSGCHSILEGQENFGPNLFGLADHKSIEYIRESIVSPNAVIVEGDFEFTMPNFGDILNENQINALVEYVSSLK